jgi:multiple sugar transport system substrate-binding protein
MSVRSRWLSLLTLLLVIAMLVSACGGAAAPTATVGAGTGTDTGAGTGTGAGAEATAGTGTDAGTEAQGTATIGTDAGTGAEGTATAGTDAAGTGTDTGTTGGMAMELPATCSNVELQYWNPFTGPDGPFMGQLVDQFNAEHPNIQVVMTTQGEYYTQLSTAAASDTLPDVAIVHADQVATQAFRNILRPIDDLVKQAGIDGGDFPESVWAAGEVAGKRYSIPLDIHPLVMFYNEDLLTKAGIEGPPTNAEEFAAAADAVAKAGGKGFQITGGWGTHLIFRALLYQFGGTEFSEDGTKATFNSEAGVQALQWMKDAQSKWSDPNLEADAELNTFKGGNVGLIMNGIWQTTNVTGEGVEFAGKATAIPQLGPKPGVWGGSHQLTLPAHKAGADECKDAAAAIFISYLLENSVTWAQAGQIPASEAVRESAEFKAIEPQASIAPSVEHVVIPPAVPGIGDAFVPLDEAVWAVMSGTTTDVKAALDDAAQRSDQILEENKANYGAAPQATQ